MPRWFASDAAGISLVGPFMSLPQAQSVCDDENGTSAAWCDCCGIERTDSTDAWCPASGSDPQVHRFTLTTEPTND